MNSHATKAVIFDFDGVIMETEPYHIEAFRKTIEEDFGLKLAYDEVLAYAGLTHAEKIRRIFRKKGLPVDFDAEAEREKILKRAFETIEKKVRKGGISLPKGLLEFLGRLKARKYKIGLATVNKRKYISRILKIAKIDKCFDAAVTSDDIKKPKPDPEIYVKAAKKLKVAPANCTAIEDSVYGIQSAKAAGMKCIAITTTNTRERLKDADIIVDGFEEIDVEKL